MVSRSERVALASFAAFVTFTGTGAVAVRFSNRELEPLWGASLRFSLAGALLLLVVAATRTAIPRPHALAGALLYGVLNVGASGALYYYGLVHLHAGLGTALIALVPLLTLLLAVLQGQERLRAGAVAGVVLALAGVVWLSRAPLREGAPLLALLAMVGSAAFVAQGIVAVRHFPPVHPVILNALAMPVGGALLFVGALLSGEAIELPGHADTWAALAYLVVLGSVVAHVLYIVVLKHWAASRAAYAFVLVPIAAVTISTWLDDEPLHLHLVGGGALVLTGVYIGALRSRQASTAPAPSL